MNFGRRASDFPTTSVEHLAGYIRNSKWPPKATADQPAFVVPMALAKEIAAAIMQNFEVRERRNLP